MPYIIYGYNNYNGYDWNAYNDGSGGANDPCATVNTNAIGLKVQKADGGPCDPSGGNPSAPITPVVPIATTIPLDDLNDAIVVNDQKPAINPADYIKCFTDGKTASSYTMTIRVDQPVTNKNNQYNIISPPLVVGTGIALTIMGGTIDVGHTFVEFTKYNTDGTSLTQVMGFYPGTASTNTKGVIKDDSNHPYDISLTATVTPNQFNNALASVLYDSTNSNYVLSNINLSTEYNCTDAAKNWMSSASVSTPSAARGLFTNTPGDFGQALRSTPGIISSNPGVASTSHGPCN
jgi:hypothetical protein